MSVLKIPSLAAALCIAVLGAGFAAKPASAQSICVTAHHDANVSGTVDANEARIPGLDFRIIGPSGQIVAAQTGSSYPGVCHQQRLRVGSTYRVEMRMASPWVNTYAYHHISSQARQYVQPAADMGNGWRQHEFTLQSGTNFVVFGACDSERDANCRDPGPVTEPPVPPDPCCPPGTGRLTSVFDAVSGAGVQSDYQLVFTPSLNPSYGQALQAYGDYVLQVLPGAQTMRATYTLTKLGTTTPIETRTVVYNIGGSTPPPPFFTAMLPPNGDHHVVERTISFHGARGQVIPFHDCDPISFEFWVGVQQLRTANGGPSQRSVLIVQESGVQQQRILGSGGGRRP